MMLILTLAGLVGAALAAGAIIYVSIMTISILKKYRQKKTSKVMAAQIRDLIRQAPAMKLGDLEDDAVILAEYDEEEDELVQDICVAKESDSRIREILTTNGGIVVFD